MRRLLARFAVRYPTFGLNVDLDVPMSGITAIFGPSGSGKTTLLRCLAGLERAPNGFMQFGNDLWQDEAIDLCLPLYKRPVGYVFQEPRLFPHYNVRANLLYGYKRIPLQERCIAMEQVVDILGIGHLLERRVHHLSGGEQQRVAIGRAFAAKPKLLLADEPTGNLDHATGAHVIDLLFSLQKQHGTTLMLITHDTDLAARCDRVVHISDGRIV